MKKQILCVLLNCFLVVNLSVGLPSHEGNIKDVIVLLKKPALCNLAFTQSGKSLYRGMKLREQQVKQQLIQRRNELLFHMKQFENRLKAISPHISYKHRFTGLINGLSMTIPKSMEDQIRSMPEVLAVASNRKYKLYLNHSHQIMKIPSAWEMYSGEENAGRGVKIGVIDTGVDHTHVMFEDAGFTYPEGYPLGDSNFTNQKIIAARVFPVSSDSAENSTPRDRDGHGTKVASCAAGNRNTLSPLGPISGVAPQAYIGNYKVFTNEFTYSDQIIRALEACVEDGMDVVNMSFGGEEYFDEHFNPEALAVKNAVNAGVVVVAAAGNAGKPDTIGPPGQFPEVITVGSLTNSHTVDNPDDPSVVYMNVYADGETILNTEEMSLGIDPAFFSTPIIGRFSISDADSIDGGAYGGEDDGLVCDALPVSSVEKQWVLVQRGICTFTSKLDRIQAAGGLGALIYNSAEADQPMGEPLRNSSVPNSEIPSYHISRNAGLYIKDALQDSDNVEVEFFTLPLEENEQRELRLSSFSSRGPSLSYTIKPDLTAIGQGLYAATQNDVPAVTEEQFIELTGFDPSGFNFANGTSFSSPIVTGVAALLKQQHPNWTPHQIKSALLISADRPSLIDRLSSMDRGAGHVNPTHALSLPLLSSPSSLSLGQIMTSDDTTVEREITLESISDQLQHLNLSLDFSDDSRIQSFTITPKEVNLTPGETIGVNMTVQLTPQNILGDFDDISGDIVIETDRSNQLIKIPVWARVFKAPVTSGRILIVDDDGNSNIENQYTEAVSEAGYTWTLWPVSELNSYPNQTYMQNFESIVWFMSETSLNSLSEEELLPNLNDRNQFNVELTRYLARGGSLLLSGMDWSDQQEFAPFGQQVLHIRNFSRDPFVTFNRFGRIQSQLTSLEITTRSNNPLTDNLRDLSLNFDDDFPNLTDIVNIDSSGIVSPVFRSRNSPRGIIGITIDANSYRAAFYAFPLERLAGNGMNALVKNTLAWLMNDAKQTLSITSITPETINDHSNRRNVTITTEGINFLLGNNLFLNLLPLDITQIDFDGTISAQIPGDAPAGVYDLTLTTPDGQTATLTEAIKIGDTTGIEDWSVY